MLCLLEIHWVVPKMVLDLLECWRGGFGRYYVVDIWACYSFVRYVDYLESTTVACLKGKIDHLWG